ncbi:MAG: hypothetical protein AAF497_00570 [Planctomycetota bacterium]
MRYRLRTLLLLLTTTAIVLGIRRYRMILKTPVSIRITDRIPPFDADEDVGPTQMLRYWDPAVRKETVAEHAVRERKYSQKDDVLKEILLGHPGKLDLDNPRHQRVIKENKDWLIANSRSYLKSGYDIRQVFRASRILGYLGDDAGFDFALKEFLDGHRKGKPVEAKRFSDFRFARREWLEQQEELIEVLHEMVVASREAKSLFRFADRRDCLLCAIEILHKISTSNLTMEVWRTRLHSSNLHEAYAAAKVILESNPSEEDIKRVFDAMTVPHEQHGGANPLGPPIADLLLQHDFAGTQDPEKWKVKVEDEVLRLVKTYGNSGGFATSQYNESFTYRTTVPHGGYNSSLSKYGTRRSLDYLRSIITSKKSRPYVRLAALRALKRLGREAEYKQHLADFVEGDKPLTLALAEYGGAHGPNEVNALKVLVQRDTDISTPAAIRIADLCKDACDDETMELIVARFQTLKQLLVKLEANYNTRYRRRREELGELLEHLGRIGDPRIEALRLPLFDTPRYSRVDDFWRENKTNPQELVDWLNTKFPSERLSVFRIESRTSDVMGYHVTIETPHCFAMVALANLSFGAYFQCDVEASPHSVLLELAKVAGPEFTVEAATSNNTGRVRFVVAKRTYQVDFDYSQDGWYDWTRMACVLNTAVADCGLAKRFVVYQGHWNNADRIVLFISPDVEQELEEEFGLIPMNGNTQNQSAATQ